MARRSSSRRLEQWIKCVLLPPLPLYWALTPNGIEIGHAAGAYIRHEDPVRRRAEEAPRDKLGLSITIGPRRVFARRTVHPLFTPTINCVLNDVCYRQDVDRRQSIVTLFLARFTLSEDEIESLISGDVPIGRRFFDAAINIVENNHQRITRSGPVLSPIGVVGRPPTLRLESLLYFP